MHPIYDAHGEISPDGLEHTHVLMNGHCVDITGTGLSPSEALPVLETAAAAFQADHPQFGKFPVTFIPTQRGGHEFKAIAVTGTPLAGLPIPWTAMVAHHARRSGGQAPSPNLS
jgi:hypothetical protein